MDKTQQDKGEEYLEKIVQVPLVLPYISKSDLDKIFINRLNKKMRLQSDPTVIYTLTNKYGNMKGRKLYSKHLQILTSYNTYKVKGLLVGAICNPGLESIKAVLHPLKTEYLYFVADGSGGHKFSKTLEEHEKNRKEWQDFKKKNK